MKKILLVIFVGLLILVVACKKTTEEVIKKDFMEKPETSSGDVVVDSVGDDISNVNSVENDLNADELNDLDSGLADVGNI